MPGSRYYALVVMDMENWGGRPAAVQARMQDSLRVMVRRALTEAEIPRAHCRYASRGDGMILALPAHVPKERITTDLVRFLEREVRAYDRSSAPEANIRLRIALHAGDVHEGDGEWAGEAVVTACRLVDADVVRRVLASADTAAVAVVVSASWYTAVISAGWADETGYERVWPQVKDYAHAAWIRVPGRTHPPGLRPSDTTGPSVPDQPREYVPPKASGGMTVVVNGTHTGNNIGRDNVGDTHFGNNYYGRERP